ncbi:MAG: hypothetical protein BGO32_11470 [Bacteroidetes bacterium 37-13]|nr:MAG: hypothetical protein BGO32_11470 [Bacteroidetes bacterium 37-13]
MHAAFFTIITAQVFLELNAKIKFAAGEDAIFKCFSQIQHIFLKPKFSKANYLTQSFRFFITPK